MHDHLLRDIGLCIGAAFVMALLARFLRQPALIGYIAAGLLLGANMGLGLITDHDTIGAISEIGLVLLLFLIGAEIDLRKLLRSGGAVLGGGVLQVPLCAALTFVLLLPFSGGGTGLDGAYLALLLSLSSTAVVVKLLYEKNEIDTLPGRISLGILVMQDLWAIVMLVVQPNLKQPDLWVLAHSLLLGLGLVGLVLLAARWVLPLLFARTAGSSELTLLLALAWCTAAAGGAVWCGLSREMGALLAGIAISTFPVNLEVVTRILSVRDSFVTLFFVTLGLRIPTPTASILLAAAGASLALVASRLLVVFPVVLAFTRDNRTAMVTTINLSQAGEFSLVIAALGVTFGHIRSETVGVITFTMVITVVLSTYLIANAYAIYLRVRPLLKRLGLRDAPEHAAAHDGHRPPRFVLLGCHRIGSAVVEEWLRRAPERKEELLVVDFNPEVRAALAAHGVRSVFGDVTNLDLLAHLHLERAEVIACTLPDSILKGSTNRQLLLALKRLAPGAKIVVTGERGEDAREMLRLGAAYVLMPHMSGGVELTESLLAQPPLPQGSGSQQQERIDRCLDLLRR